MSDFEERARAEAERRLAADPTDGAAYDVGFGNGFVDGAWWARTLTRDEMWAAVDAVADLRGGWGLISRGEYEEIVYEVAATLKTVGYVVDREED